MLCSVGVDKCSVDTWMSPSQFRMGVSTGAPPDFFSPEGQNWGFPTYCWEEMARDGYSWWRRRLKQLSQCASSPTIRLISRTSSFSGSGPPD